jgi:hypothetical protein
MTGVSSNAGSCTIVESVVVLTRDIGGVIMSLRMEGNLVRIRVQFLH